MGAGNLLGIVAGIVVLVFGAVTLALRIPQSSRALRLQNLRRAGNVVYMTRRTAPLSELARHFGVEDSRRLKWEFFIRVIREGWILSNSDLTPRAFVPWAAIGSIRVADDAPCDRIFRNVRLRVGFKVGSETSDLDLYLFGWMWTGYPLPSDPSAEPIDVASMNAVVRELEGLRPSV